MTPAPAPAPTRPIGGIAGWFAGLGGWRRAGVATALGLIAIAAQPPISALPVLLVAFPGLIWLLDGCDRGRQAAAVGWWFGFGYFSAGLYWLGNALLVDPARFGWMIPFAVGGVSAYLALFPALACYLCRRAGRTGVARIFVFATAWAAAEWLRGELLTGFPWNPLGNVWVASDAMMQGAAVVGVFGLGLVTALAVAMPAVLGDGGRRRWLAPAAALAGLALIGAGGAWRLAAAEPGVVAGVSLRIVQPNIDQRDKWRANRRDENLARQVRLSLTAGLGGITAVIWPESAVPYFLGREDGLRQALAAAVPPGGMLLTGAPRAETSPDGPLKLWNSFYAIDDKGTVRATYDKFHLVPFGEFVPLRWLLGLTKLVPGDVDFSPGPGPRSLHLAGLPAVSPLICYEAIFPGEVTQQGAPPGWLLNLTNDGWFGRSSGPYQHFASARMRAVEEGLPLVRAANTGISAIVDAHGRVVRRLGLGAEGVIDGPLPVALARRTVFARFGNLTLLALIAGGGAAAWLLGRRNG